jgi:hypothetical protein
VLELVAHELARFEVPRSLTTRRRLRWRPLVFDAIRLAILRCRMLGGRALCLG